MAQALSKFLQTVPPGEYRSFAAGLEPLGKEQVGLRDALGRVLAEAVRARESLPPFRRSVMDGFAVRAADTTGASAAAPSYLALAGEVQMGRAAGIDIAPGACCRIPTGGMLPASADAVVMVEYTREIPGNLVEITAAAAPGENVVLPGDDITAGEPVLPAGRVLRPQEVGILAGLGAVEIQVYRRVRAAILSTGDELVEPSAVPGPGQVRNVNQYSLMAHVAAIGGEPHLLGIAPDDRGEIERRVRRGLDLADLVIISGGSSVGTRDLTASIIDGLGKPGVIFHGVAARPGMPTILGRVDGRILFGLPGHPIAAMVSFHNFVRPVMLALGGVPAERDWPVTAVLADNIHSRPGREDYVQVSLESDGAGKLLARPIFRKSGMVTALTASDGYLVIPASVEGLEKGDEVSVHLHRPVLR